MKEIIYKQFNDKLYPSALGGYHVGVIYTLIFSSKDEIKNILDKVSII